MHSYTVEVVDALRGINGLVGNTAADSCWLTAIQSANETGIDMLAVVVAVPDANRLTTTPAAVVG